MEPLQRIQCEWCQSQNLPGAVTCVACGARLDVKNLVSDSGWREAPRLRDMTEIQFGGSTCQMEGEIVPVAETNLGAGDTVFFEHHVLLWKEENVRLEVMQLPGGLKRMLAGMPFIITMATGPGRVAFSRDATGELVLLPLHPGMEMDVREHAFLVASHHINY
ncbi:MAG: AIM24 family protein, partial [Armatimonadota bacterium]|nr:AIM24 family protein [Armatimonadota bacterium]